jgi:hypothetical protein
MRIHKRTLLWAGVLLGLTLIGLISSWWSLYDLGVAEQRRLDVALVGKTRAEIDQWAGDKAYAYVPKEKWAQELPGFRPQNEEDAALGYWTTGPAPTHDGAIRVIFDRNGAATNIRYSSFSGPWQRARRWLGL